MIARKVCNSIKLSVFSIVLLSTPTTSVLSKEVDAKLLLEQMSTEIAGLDAFILNGEAYNDARLANGQIIEHSSHVTLRLSRLNGMLHMTNRNAGNSKEIYFNDGLLSIYSKTENFYAQRNIPKGLPAMLDFAVNEMEIDVPLLDFISSDIGSELLKDAEGVRYLDTSLIRNEVFHHVGVRLQDVDVQVWIATQGRPLPRKLVITSKWEGGSPRFVGFFDWNVNPNFPNSAFIFNPPDDAVQIKFLIDLDKE